MSGLLPFGNLAHTVFISCQMLFLIILSFPVVPPPRQRRPPRLLPLAPYLSPRGRESPIPFKSTYSASPTALFFVLILISLLDATPTFSHPLLSVDSHVWERFGWGETVGILAPFVEPLDDVRYDLYTHRYS